jgi:SAM-dependent methyltransferase
MNVMSERRMVSGGRRLTAKGLDRARIPPMTDLPDFGDSRGPLRPREAHEFDQFYEGTPPWDIGRPQPAFVALAEAGVLTGRVLDVGCGTGEHALLAAGLGLEATGVDAAPTAVARAREKAGERGLEARFLVADACDLGALREQFDTVLDSGLFHVFEDADRARYVESLAAAIRPGGRYFMLCFSEHQPGDWGPRRVTQAEIRASFSAGWQVDSIEADRLHVTFDPGGVAAWLAALTRGVAGGPELATPSTVTTP